MRSGRRRRPSGLGILAAICLGVGWAMISPRLQAQPTVARTPPSTVPARIKNPLTVVSKTRARFVHASGSDSLHRINIIFLAKSPHQLLACLADTDWIATQPPTLANFLRADLALVEHHFDLTAPLKRWFWQNHPQRFQLTAPTPGRVSYTRDSLRIWSTGKRLSSGGLIYVGVTDQTHLGPWYWLDKARRRGDISRRNLIHSLNIWTYGTVIRSVPSSAGHPASAPGRPYPLKGLSIIDVRHCSER